MSREVKRGPTSDPHLVWREQPCFEAERFTYGFVGLLTSLLVLYANKAFVQGRPEVASHALVPVRALVGVTAEPALVVRDRSV